MENFVIFIKSFFSFIWKIRNWIICGIFYLIGRNYSNKNNKIEIKDKIIENNQNTVKTIEKMEKAAINSPKNKEELINILNEGKF